MGPFFHPITLIGPTGATETVEALVDTNLLFAIFPAPVLERLGVIADRSARLRIGGQERTCRLGQVEAKLDDHPATIICIFGEPDELSRVGRHALDSFLLEADLVGRRLVPKTFWLITHV